MSPIEVKYHKKFLKEKRKLSKKCSTFDNDFKRFVKALITDIKYNDFKVPTNIKKYSKISGLDKRVSLPAFVAKKFYCEGMNRGSDSGYRFTFIFDSSENLIYFVQIYFKGNQEIEDLDRINNLFK